MTKLADSMMNRLSRSYELNFDPETEQPAYVSINGRILQQVDDSDGDEGYRIEGNHLILTDSTDFQIGDEIEVFFKPKGNRKSPRNGRGQGQGPNKGVRAN